MLFNSWIYAFFLASTVVIYWLLPRWEARHWFLIAAGAVFYAYYYPPHLPIIIGFTALIFLTTAVAAPRHAPRKPWVLGGGAAACIGILAYFKYQGLAQSSLAAIGYAGSDTWIHDVRAPLAVSFFTFEYVHYLIELRRGSFARAGLRDFFLFILFFPTLICGPIKRFNAFQPQIGRGRLDVGELSAGVGRIVVGIAKKIVVADTVAHWIKPIWADPSLYRWGALWLGTYGYAVQIYFDFAGYSDIAIGSAQLLGYHVPENFDAPYLKSNIAAFWRSWHMSLTTWITDYVYIPLGGNRRGAFRSQANRLTAMTLCGLWHGAAWHFAIWGMYHGLGLNAYRGYQTLRRRLRPEWRPSTMPAARAVATLATFHFVCIGWVLFVTDFSTACGVIARLLLIR